MEPLAPNKIDIRTTNLNIMDYQMKEEDYIFISDLMIVEDFDVNEEVKKKVDTNKESSIQQMLKYNQQSQCQTAQQGCSFKAGNKCHSFESEDTPNLCGSTPNNFYQQFPMNQTRMNILVNEDFKNEPYLLDDSNNSNSESCSVECELENEDSLDAVPNQNNEGITSISPLGEHSATKKIRQSFQCPECEYKTSHSSHMYKHIRTHTGERPFECSVCNRRFSDSSARNKHMRTHTGEKPFQCTVCTKMFAWPGDISRHMMTHTGEKPFKCTVCDKTFSRFANLKTHIKSHSGEKPLFNCPVCDRKYTHFSSLKVHMRIHINENPPLMLS